METNFLRHVAEWREMNQTGRFAEARQYYFERLFDEVIENFVKQSSNIPPIGSNVDVLFSVLGFTPEPIILAARALNPKRHIIFHDSGVKFNEDNMRYLSRFLPKGFEKIEFPDESFATIYDIFKSRMALTAGRNYVINVTGGKKSMVAAASIFARDFNSSVIYVDYHDYDANLRRPMPGTEYLNVVYSPLRDLPELFHVGIYNESTSTESAEENHEVRRSDSNETLVNPFPMENEYKSNDEFLEHTKEISESSSSIRPEQKDVNIASILSSTNRFILKEYLDKNLKGKNIHNIQLEVTEALCSFSSAQTYWKAVELLIDYNPIVFLSPITKAHTPNISNLGVEVDAKDLDLIIHKAFRSSNKLKYAIELLMPCKSLLSNEQRDFIMNSCKGLNSSDLFYKLFKLTRVSPSVSIDYLLDLNSKAAAFTLYKIYADGLKNGMLRDDSQIESLRPIEIAKCCAKMQESTAYAFRVAALLIKNRILSKGRVDRVLMNEINQNGFAGFHKYIVEKEQNIKTERIATSFSKGDLLTKLRFIKQLDNYYLFVNNESQSYALLDKELTSEIPSKDVIYEATILDMKVHHGKRVFFIAMGEVSTEYSYPPLINNESTVEISFSQSKNGEWCPVKNNYCKILSIEIIREPKELDYRKKQRAVIVQSVDFFTYKVEIL